MLYLYWLDCHEIHKTDGSGWAWVKSGLGLVRVRSRVSWVSGRVGSQMGLGFGSENWTRPGNS